VVAGGVVYLAARRRDGARMASNPNPAKETS